MRHLCLLFLLALLSPDVPDPLVTAEPPAAPKPEEVLAIMKKMADWQLAHPGKNRPTDWTQGVYYTGIMALYEVCQNPKYFNAMVAMGEKNEWKPGLRPFHADDFAVCQTYAEIYALRKDPDYIIPTMEAFNRIIDTLKDKMTKPGDPGFTFTDQRWNWCDALFMAPPAWVRLYGDTWDNRYLAFMDHEWWVTYQVLYDPAEHLFYRDSGFFNKKTPSGTKVFWSRGNGWVYAGLARLLEYLPQDYPTRPKYVKVFKEMTGSILKAQQPDGLWRSSLLDPNQIPLGETSGSGLFVFGLQWGVNNGILDKTQVGSAIDRGWAGLIGKVQPSGMLGNVQPVGAAPDKFTPQSTAVYGTGAFLLAGSEIYKSSKKAQP